MDETTLQQDSIRILLIEDSPLDADLFQSYLALTNLTMPTIVVAERLSRAVELVGESDFDVVFLDYKLPDSEGADSLARLKKEIPYVPIVMLTGLDDDVIGLEMVQRGAQDYLVKDQVNEDVLWRVLRYAIARKRIEAQQREFQERLREAQRAESLTMLAGGIAHSYNNLLTSIMGNASLAISGMPHDDSARTFLREIQKAAKRAAVLTNQMLTYSGQCRGNLSPLDLGEFVTRMAPFLRTVRDGGGLLEYDVTPRVMIKGDTAHLQQLVVNLVENAREAMAQAGREDGAVQITVSPIEFAEPQQFDGFGEYGSLQSGAYARIAVSDTGCGMERATLSKAFDPFFTTKFTGRGLGLASVLGIVRAHQGAIRVVSAVGEGTTFVVFLPTVAAVGLPAEEEEGTASPFSGRGLMVVADEEMLVASVTRKILERYGYTVLPADSAEGVLGIVAERHGEMTCVLLDCGLLRDPIAFVRELRERTPHVGVLLTSDSEESPVDLGLFAGEVQYLRKPYLPRELMARVQAASGCGGEQDRDSTE
ncbi:MAG: response regulator [Victivallales bacterium]|jgi:two-component system, cell cycle sensor histidine kinase and response regulator CckA|nr:response regulator [Victivallales bacterium]